MATIENDKNLFKTQKLEKSFNKILNGKFKIKTLNKFQLKSNLIRIFLSSTFTGNYNLIYSLYILSTFYKI